MIKLLLGDLKSDAGRGHELIHEYFASFRRAQVNFHEGSVTGNQTGLLVLFLLLVQRHQDVLGSCQVEFDVKTGLHSFRPFPDRAPNFFDKVFFVLQS